MIRQTAAAFFAAASHSSPASAASAVSRSRPARHSPPHQHGTTRSRPRSRRRPARRPMSRATAIAIRSRRSSFFGVEPDDTVVEIWPGGGWYTEILAPYLARGGGQLLCGVDGRGRHNGMRRLMAANPALYGRINLAAFPAFAAGGNARARRQRRRRPHLPQRPQLADGLSARATSLMPRRRSARCSRCCGRAARSASSTIACPRAPTPRASGAAAMSRSRPCAGSPKRRASASSALRRSTPIRATPPIGRNGVWTLPPPLRLGDQDRERYLAIGESDRMTLRFVKPEVSRRRR